MFMLDGVIGIKLHHQFLSVGFMSPPCLKVPINFRLYGKFENGMFKKNQNTIHAVDITKKQDSAAS